VKYNKADMAITDNEHAIINLYLIDIFLFLIIVAILLFLVIAFAFSFNYRGESIYGIRSIMKILIIKFLLFFTLIKLNNQLSRF
jgi:hypothetical protein